MLGEISSVTAALVAQNATRRVPHVNVFTPARTLLERSKLASGLPLVSRRTASVFRELDALVIDGDASVGINKTPAWVHLIH